METRGVAMKKSFVLACILALAPAMALANPNIPGNTPTSQAELEKKVGHELVMLPFYTIFDNLSYRVDGNQVILSGEVTHPALKQDAGNVVKNINGVASVANNIEVLPTSPFDDQIRWRVYRAVFGGGELYRYAMGANPSVHIVVRHGDVTLVGRVATEFDRRLANMQANLVPGVFSVTNNLQVGS
jgi:hyperosmotically inducible periplasmic protein